MEICSWRERTLERRQWRRRRVRWLNFYSFAPRGRNGFSYRRSHEARGLVWILWTHTWDQKGNHDWREFWNRIILFQNWGACVDTFFGTCLAKRWSKEVADGSEDESANLASQSMEQNIV
jgi:hypothetical protein